MDKIKEYENTIKALEKELNEKNRLIKDGKKYGFLIECCLGCGEPYGERDCGCPAGSCWSWDKSLLKNKK